MFLINLPGDQAFVAMKNMLERHCMRSFYGGASAKEDVEAYYRIFDTLLADVMPKVYFNFKQHAVSPAQYLPGWLISIFLEHLPFETCCRIWDIVILEGDAFLFRTAIAILGVMESRLFFPDQKELMEVLRGENKAAMEVARRAGPLRVDLGARYEQYGVTEEALWDRLEQTEWKESTWSRLSHLVGEFVSEAFFKESGGLTAETSVDALALLASKRTSCVSNSSSKPSNRFSKPLATPFASSSRRSKSVISASSISPSSTIPVTLW